MYTKHVGSLSTRFPASTRLVKPQLPPFTGTLLLIVSSSLFPSSGREKGFKQGLYTGRIGFEFSEYLREKTWVTIYTQHVVALFVHNGKTSIPELLLVGFH